MQLDSLTGQFDKRFQDFKNLEPQFNILGSPFTTDVYSAPEDIRRDLQGNNVLKKKFKSDSPPDLYKSLSYNLFQNLKNFAPKFFTLFGSTYICEHALSCLKINKSKNRSLLTDTNLHALMRMSNSKLADNFKKIVKNCEQLKSP